LTERRIWRDYTRPEAVYVDSSAEEAGLVTAAIGLRELLLVQRTDSAQQLELVLQVRAHHLRAIRCDRERNTRVDERSERVPHGFLVRQRLRQQVRRRANLEHDLRIADRTHQVRIACRQDPVADPVRA